MGNQLKVEKPAGGELQVKVIDGDDVEHDITSKFRSISGSTTPAKFSNSFNAQDDGTSVVINFTALGKEMVFDLDAPTIKQLVALAD